MGLMLDTSAVIGWVELQSEELLETLLTEAGDSTPAIHAVTLGELEAGVLSAGDLETKARRLATLQFSRDELTVISLPAVSEQTQLFAVVNTAVSRKISHNDCWIAAATLANDAHLLTMDRRLSEELRAAAEGDGPLADWLKAHDQTLKITYVSVGAHQVGAIDRGRKGSARSPSAGESATADQDRGPGQRPHRQAAALIDDAMRCPRPCSR